MPRPLAVVSPAPRGVGRDGTYVQVAGRAEMDAWASLNDSGPPW
jgi:hypothetical protein